MSDKSETFKTDYARVHGLGLAKDGTHHWWLQRLTAIALALLAPFFIWPLAANLGTSFEEVRAAYASPWNAIVAGLFVITAFFHLNLGNRVVIEDYIHNKGLRTALLVASSGFCALMAFVGVFAIFKLALG